MDLQQAFSTLKPKRIKADPPCPATRTIVQMSESEASELARVYLNSGQLEASSYVVETWLKKNTGVWMRREKYEIAYALGHQSSALEGLKRLTEDYPDNAAAHSTYIQRLQNTGQREKAKDLLADAASRFHDDVWILNLAADEAERSGLYQEAFEARRKSLNLRSDIPLARAGMARALMAVGKTDSVLALLDGHDVEFGQAPIADLEYLTPKDLQVSPTPMRRALVVGSCLASGLPDIFAANAPYCEADFVITNNGMGLPAEPPRDLADYDFQYIQLPLRAVLPEAAYFHLRYDQPETYQALFDAVCDTIASQLADVMKWNVDTGLLTFVSNFLPPQQNPLGRLVPRYDLRNMVYFINKMNEFLANEIAGYANAYLLDIDQIGANMGRRNFQDDVLWTVSHGAALSDADYVGDQQRLEPIDQVGAYYPHQPYRFSLLIWREIEAMYRSIHQLDMVKMVLVDLDDTMWRGVLADNGSTDLEGWPLAFGETLAFLKQRGIILGIVSKNTESRIRELWPYHDLLRLQDFAIHRINWTPKADNIAEILEEVNLLPKSVVFIDDNPVEREAVKRAFPEMRVFGSNPYLWRRILLWSAETQTSTITTESATRSDMIQAGSKRESRRKTQSRPEFLKSLNIRVTMTVISDIADPSFARALELINKTNQFNTTGHRWTLADSRSWFETGGTFHAMTVVDDFTPYGLVGVLCIKDDRIDQFVMSCRVIGLDVELAAVSHALSVMQASGKDEVHATIVETSANLLSRDIWTRTGFTGRGEFLRLLEDIPAVPEHVSLTAA